MEQENIVPEPENTQPVNKTPTPNTEPETQEQINWRKFREAREVERKQRDAAEKKAAEKEAEAMALKAALEAVVNKPSAKQQTTHDVYYPDQDESEDDKIQKKIEAAIADRERKRDEERLRKEQAEFPQRLQATYNDFNQVCTADNLDYIEYHHPEVADAFSHLPDGFDKWSKIYKAVKRYVPNIDSKKEASKAEKNFNKPQAMSIPGKTQVGDSAPHSLDDKRKMDNWNRMQRVMRGG